MRTILTVEEDRSEHSVTSANVCADRVIILIHFSVRFGVSGSANGPDGVRNTHAGGGCEEEDATTGLVDDQGAEVGGTEIVDLENTVDQVLLPGRSDSCQSAMPSTVWYKDRARALTDTVQSLGQVVADDTVTRPLREKGNRNDDGHTAQVAASGKEGLESRVVLGEFLDTDGLADLVDLELDQRVIDVAVAVEVGENLFSLSVTAVVDEPTRRLGDEPDEEELDNRGETCPLATMTRTDICSTHPAQGKGYASSSRSKDGKSRK